MKRRNKLFITLSLLLITLLTVSIPNVYADEFNMDIAAEDLERLANAESKAESAGLVAATNIWMTSNIDIEKALPFLEKYMLWNNEYPYKDDPSNDDVDLELEIKEDQFGTVLVSYFQAGLNKPKYGRFTRIKQIESYDNAEYLIASTDYDCYTVLVDGNTYKNKDLGPLLNEAIKSNSLELKEYPNFKIPYDGASAVFDTTVYLKLYKTLDDVDHMVIAQAKVGFNLTLDSYHPVINNPVDDDYIYGGDENNKLDPTPSTPEGADNIKFDLGKAIGITISVLSGIVITYIAYILIMKIYELVKEKK